MIIQRLRLPAILALILVSGCGTEGMQHADAIGAKVVTLATQNTGHKTEVVPNSYLVAFRSHPGATTMVLPPTGRSSRITTLT